MLNTTPRKDVIGAGSRKISRKLSRQILEKAELTADKDRFYSLSENMASDARARETFCASKLTHYWEPQLKVTLHERYTVLLIYVIFCFRFHLVCHLYPLSYEGVSKPLFIKSAALISVSSISISYYVFLVNLFYSQITAFILATIIVGFKLLFCPLA